MPKVNNLITKGVPGQRKGFVAAYLRIFFKLLYHQFAWTYDVVASIVSLGAWKEWVQSILPYIHGQRILEIGFGPGHLQLSLHQRDCSVYGLDESAQMGRMAYRRLSQNGFSPNLCRGLAQAMPYPDNYFDQVVLTFPSEFIINPSTLDEIHRVLNNNGAVVILPFAWITGRNPVRRLVAWINHTSGEAPDWNEKILEPFKHPGYNFQWELVTLKFSKIIIITMEKGS